MLGSVLRVSGKYLEGVLGDVPGCLGRSLEIFREVFGQCLERCGSVWRMFCRVFAECLVGLGRCLGRVLKVFGGVWSLLERRG